jgi:hypothetical protein
VSTGPKIKPSKKPAEVGFKVSSCLAYSLTLKMEAIYCSKTLGFLQIEWDFKPEDCTPHSHHWENLKSNRTLRNLDAATTNVKKLGMASRHIPLGTFFRPVRSQLVPPHIRNIPQSSGPLTLC